MEETIRLHKTAGIPRSMLVLAEPPESLIVLATNHSRAQPAVIWLDSSDVSNLNKLESLRDAQVWSSYTDFFDYLLDREVEERS